MFWRRLQGIGYDCGLLTISFGFILYEFRNRAPTPVEWHSMAIGIPLGLLACIGLRRLWKPSYFFDPASRPPDTKGGGAGWAAIGAVLLSVFSRSVLGVAGSRLAALAVGIAFTICIVYMLLATMLYQPPQNKS